MKEDDIAAALGVRKMDEVAEDAADSEVEAAYGELVEWDKKEVATKDEKVPAAPAPFEPNEEIIDELEDAQVETKKLYDKAEMALDDLLALGKQGESTRAYEVAMNYMKTMMELNDKKVDNARQKAMEKEEKNPEATQTNVTNNNLILTTADLLAQLTGSAKKDET